ncbi:hypothetical protein HX109_15395 [Galbibacter sp. BG1]|uniref:hypothetical protein n=1 Tax=Galbibacter sp. BG1 TaxID=1170699 RepID=UPI0015B89FDE|nr:hypothetical protein [Galbibacter sp. BG1]QLE02884.1 hypothetical protein HX109_15395 [Galbibacter sp. BG1]
MKQTSDLVYQYIKAFDDANGTPFNGMISPILGPVEDTYPFCVYKVERRPTFSKNGCFEYDVQIRLVADDYDKVCELADALAIDFEAYYEFFYQGTESDINTDKPTEYVLTLTYQLLKNS